MPKVESFDRYTNRYEEWFEQHPLVYQSELRAVKELLPAEGTGIEIGVGTGRFAAPSRIEFGLDPSLNMLRVAAERGIHVIGGQAEKLPFGTGVFDFALMVTTICFLDNVEAALHEVYRVLKPGGSLLIGFVDRHSSLGEKYQKNKAKNPFYREATFYTAEEVTSILKQAGYRDLIFRQTIFQSLESLQAIEPVEAGFGRGAFIVTRGEK